jgi:hypothetical protein
VYVDDKNELVQILPDMVDSDGEETEGTWFFLLFQREQEEKKNQKIKCVT